MSDFDAALAYVHGVLSDLQSSGASLVVPVEVLQNLASVGQGEERERQSDNQTIRQGDRARVERVEAPTPAPVAAARPRPAVPVLPILPSFSAPAPAAGSKAERL